MTAKFAEGEPFSLILDALDDGVTVFDREGTLLWVNKKVCDISGMSRAKLIGLNVGEMVALPGVEASVVTPPPGSPSRPQTSVPSPRIEDYAGPGYAALKNGMQIHYTVQYVRDAHGTLLYGVGTVRDVSDLDMTGKQITDLQRLTTLYQDQLATLHTRVMGHTIIYKSASMRRIFERTTRLARLDGNILLTGETGVGKSMLAQYLHVMSRRAEGPFMQINCATLPESLIEAELFGYSAGAFTGASRKGRRGVIEMGHGGTVFLDEIGDMSVAMQAKLLTVLEDKRIRRLGGEKLITVDVRFVAATNKNPEVLIQQDQLRSDLYYRLAMNRIDLPPLRERRTDIPALIDAALSEFNDKNVTSLTLHKEIVDRLCALPLHGNVRELRNLVWQIVSEVEQETGEIGFSLLPAELVRSLDTRAYVGVASAGTTDSMAPGTESEEQRLRTLCIEHGGDVRAIAKVLDVHRTTVIRKLKRYGLSYTRNR